MKVFAIIFMFAIVTVAVSGGVVGGIRSDEIVDPMSNVEDDGVNWTVAGLSDDFEKAHLQAIVKHLEKNLGVQINENDDLEQLLQDALRASNKTVDQFLDDLTEGADIELNDSA